MNMGKMAAFLADCLSYMPKRPEQVRRAVDTVIAGLNRIANGGEWPRDEAYAAMAAADAAYWAGWATDAASDAAYWTADWTAEAHPDPDAERARQAKVREDLGL